MGMLYKVSQRRPAGQPVLPRNRRAAALAGWLAFGMEKQRHKILENLVTVTYDNDRFVSLSALGCPRAANKGVCETDS